jgi:hypothetical protein
MLVCFSTERLKPRARCSANPLDEPGTNWCKRGRIGRRAAGFSSETVYTPRAGRSCGAEDADVQFLGMNAAPYSHPLLNALARVLTIVRLPIVAVLLLLEPVVNVVCGAAAVLGVLAAVVFELSAAGPRFPFLQVTAIAFACGVLLILYHSAIALLVRD